LGGTRILIGTQLCGTIENNTGNGQWYEVICSKPLRGNLIRLETTQNTYLSISGIEVWSSADIPKPEPEPEVPGYKSLIGEKPHGCYKDSGKRDLPKLLKGRTTHLECF